MKSFKVFNLLICGFAGLIILSCNNSPKPSKEIFYLQISFKEHFSGQTISVYVNDIEVLRDTLRSGFADGVTNGIINIYQIGPDRFVAKVKQREIYYQNSSDQIRLSTVLNGQKTVYMVSPEKGKYLGFNLCTDGNMNYSQHSRAPIYD